MGDAARLSSSDQYPPSDELLASRCEEVYWLNMSITPSVWAPEFWLGHLLSLRLSITFMAMARRRLGVCKLVVPGCVFCFVLLGCAQWF